MSVKSIPCYYVECDGCGRWSTDGGEYAVWSDQGSAEDEAWDCGWLYTDDGRWLCELCRTEEDEDPDEDPEDSDEDPSP